ncbi:hypothetical protein Hanom_Chr12g01076931 [Helianthus anomalus]
MHNKGVAAIANSVLNATELDQAVAALIDVAHTVRHHGRYLECAQHVEEALGQHFGTRHSSVTDQSDAMLSQAKESILEHPETVELSDEEEEAGGGGDGGNE